MQSDLGKIGSIVAVAHATVGGELAFAYPEVLKVIKLCTANGIAVLGVEVFVVRPEGHETERLSIYDQQMNRRVQENGWPIYVADNNRRADEFVRLNPSGDDRVYVLTAASWAEFCKAQRFR